MGHDHPHDHPHEGHSHEGHSHEGHSHEHAPTATAERRHVVQKGAVLDIGGDVGALLVQSVPELDGREIELYDESGNYLMHTEVHGREVAGGRQYAGLFPAVKQGSYLLDVGSGDRRPVVVNGGAVATVDARS